MDDRLSPHPVLLYDGLCGFCNGAVRFILRHDRRAIFRFAPLQGDFGQALLARHPDVALIDSFLLVDRSHTGEERILVRSDAALRVARELGWPWRLAGLFVVVPRFIRDAAYDLFARSRYRLFRRYESCPVPSADQRGRFM
jgi:predicted DCC family thiol-disulfide oxidoreductase YuxK